jgi:hypothetical protein
VVLMPKEPATAGPKVPAETQATAAMMTSLATTSNQSVLVGVNYLDRSATTILAGGSGELI